MNRAQAIILLLLITFSVFVTGCGNTTTEDDHAGRIVYVDTVTQEALVAEISTKIPAIHPQTGKRTLMPGLYCSQCKKWYPVPPPERINRIPNAAKCPKTGQPLSSEGPWPDEIK